MPPCPKSDMTPETRQQVAAFDGLLLELARETERARPRARRLRDLAEAVAWEFEPLRAMLTGEEPLPDLRRLGAIGHRGERRR